MGAFTLSHHLETVHGRPRSYLPGRNILFPSRETEIVYGTVVRSQRLQTEAWGIAGRKCEILILGLPSDWLFGQSNVFQQGPGAESLR